MKRERKTKNEKKSKIVLFILLVGILVIVGPKDVSAEPIEEWSKTFGGSSYDGANSVQQTSDNGYIIAGHTCSFGTGEGDFWLVKTDSDGNEEWNKTFGGSYEDWANSIQQTSDNGYIVAGYTYSFGEGYSSFWLVKTDSNGNEEWNKTFGGSGDEYANSVQQTSDGGYIIAGSTRPLDTGHLDVYLIKTDSDGNEEWNKTFGGSYGDVANSVQQTSDYGYIVAGSISSFGAGNYDFWLVKTDSDGNEEWNKTFGGSSYDGASSIQQTSDNGYIIAGHTCSFGEGESDFWLVKTDSDGNEEWNKTFGGSYSDVANSVQQTSDNGYIVAGHTSSFGAGESDFWLVKTDSDGNEEWNKTFGGSSYDGASSIQQTSDNGYIVAGYTYSFGTGEGDFWLVKLRSKSLSEEAAELAKQVIGKDYGHEWYEWPEKLKGFTNKYYVGDEGIVKLLNDEQIESLDCSGLIFWSYNRAYYDDKEIFAGWRGEKKEGDWENRPVYWYHANMQYYGNVRSINKEDLGPGDLLFFDTDDNATMDHVAMYVGPFMYDSTEYNVIHAEGVSTEKITQATYNSETEEVITPGAATLEVTAYGRVKDAEKPGFKVISGSPVDLIVTDPEEETINKEMGESLTMEYVTYDIDGDGELNDIVASPERKIGNYSIEIVSEPNALPEDIYSLQATIDDQTMVIAEDVQIQDIPEDPYEIESILCYSDFDDSNDVDFIDYAIFASHWFEQDCNYPTWCEGTDLDYSGSVEINDFAIFAENWLWPNSGGQGGEMGGSSSQQMEQPLDIQPVQQVQPTEVQPVKKINIGEMVSLLEEIWLQDDGIREVISEDRWNEFINKVRNPQDY